MINRILIRIKVIQILYSFLLVEKQFSLASPPESPTKEKRFAYALYLDLLVLMLRASSEISLRGWERPLEATRFLKRIASEDAIRSLMNKYRVEPFSFEGMVEPLAAKIKNSAIYKNYLQTLKDGNPDEGVWGEIFNILIAPDPEINAIISRRENYTLKGYDRTRQMVNESLSNFLVSQDSVSEALKALDKSLDMAYELYYRLLWLPVELTDMEERRLDDRRYRYLATHQDLNPNLRFVRNSLVERIRNMEKVSKFIEQRKISWEREDPVMMENLLRAIQESDIYRSYMENDGADEHADCEFWREAMRKIVLTNTYFLESMEDKSVFWNDDLDSIGTFVVKSMRRIEDGAGEQAVLDQFKDEEDAAFGSKLVRLVLKNKEIYRGYIDRVVDRNLWESERLAFMDVVVMLTAIAEILNFPKIPLTVSLNEYIEIAKSYSSAKSGGFVNGILGKVIQVLKQEGELVKNS